VFSQKRCFLSAVYTVPRKVTTLIIVNTLIGTYTYCTYLSTTLQYRIIVSVKQISLNRCSPSRKPTTPETFVKGKVYRLLLLIFQMRVQLQYAYYHMHLYMYIHYTWYTYYPVHYYGTLWSVVSVFRYILLLWYHIINTYL